jgi:hypothetical protein
MDLVPNYFFLDQKLYKKIRVVKSENYVVAWSYEDERRMRFNYSSVRQEASKAFNVNDVSELIDKPKSLILSFLQRNLIDYPSGRLYSIKNKLPGRWMWSEQDILDLRETIFEMAPKNKYGEPYSNFKLVSKAELLSKMREDTSYYVRNEKGDFVKIWRAL